MNRRTFLAASGVGLATPLVGCLGGSSEPPGGDVGTETETTTGRDSDEGDTVDAEIPEDTELVEHETLQYAATGMRPDWFEESGESVGNVVVIGSEDRAKAVLSRDDLPSDREEEVRNFLRDTDFSESVLLYVESVGPNACNDEIEVEDVAFDTEDGELSATASVVDSSERGDGSGESDTTEGGGGITACAQTITYPSALVRATFSGEPATRATVRIVDGWDNETEVTATADDSLSPGASDLDGYVRPEGDPATVPEGLACDDEAVQRVRNWADESEIPWGAAEFDDGTQTFALRVDQREVGLGETVEITMTNVTDESQYTGNRHKHSVEIFTADGWQDVRVAPEDQTLAYTDEAIAHAPGEGFQWSFELTEDGILDGHAHEGALDVCPDLQPGRYRFVFWEPTVAVAFDVTE